MSKKILVFIALLFWGVTVLVAQTELDKSAKNLGISLKIPSFYSVSENTGGIYPAEITDENPVPDLAQQYQLKPAHGNTFFNAYFGLVTAVFEHSNKECLVFVYIPPGIGIDNFGKISKDSLQLETFKHISFRRIRSNFQYGKPFTGISELDAMELYSMLTHYPSAKARKMFNAAAMVSYPLSFRGNVYKEKFTRGKGLVFGKLGHEMYLYFLMTDQSVLDFDKYLDEFDQAFVLN